MTATKHIISKSAKRKISSTIEFPVEVDGKTVLKKVHRNKANDFTQQVVYKTKGAKGKLVSQTRHEVATK